MIVTMSVLSLVKVSVCPWLSRSTWRVANPLSQPLLEMPNALGFSSSYLKGSVMLTAKKETAMTTLLFSGLVISLMVLRT